MKSQTETHTDSRIESNASNASASTSKNASTSRKAFHFSTLQAYALNTVLILIALFVGQALISASLISRYQISVLEQVGIYIILAVSLNLVTGNLGQLPLGHAGFMSVGGYSGAIFIMHMATALHLS